MIADMHCHVDLFPNYVAVAQEAQAQDVWILAVTTTPKAFSGTLQRLKPFSRIRVALGLHPELVHLRAASEIALWERLVLQCSYVGEIGLDGSPALRAHAYTQISIFRRMLEVCATIGGRVLSIHSRRAAGDVLNCLRCCRDSGLPILHWFSGSKDELDTAVKLDCWFSVGIPMLESSSGLDRIRAMPRQRVLLETDSPFAKKKDQTTLRPTAVHETLDRLANLWGIDRTDALHIVEQNQQFVWTVAGEQAA